MSKITKKLLIPEVEDGYLGKDSLMDSPEFSDNLDVVRHSLKIHSLKHKDITPDYLLFKSSEKDREFVEEIYKIAHITAFYLKSAGDCTKEQQKRINKEADELCDLMLADTVMLATLKRNEYENPLLAGIFARFNEVEEKGVLDGIKDLFSGKKKEE